MITISTLLCGVALLMSAQQSIFKFKGVVRDKDGNGISKVVVNDGIHFTQTDSKGEWTLLSDTTFSKFVSISTPAAYKLPQQDGLAVFYVPVKDLANETSYTFILEKRTNENKDFYYIAISDPQVRDEKDMKRWKTETVPDIQLLVDSLKQSREIIGMTLCDLVFDNMNLYGEYKASLQNMGMTVFQCIGNHDFNLKYQDLHNMRQMTPVYGEMVYGRYFGPTDYSFNMGRVHIVTMKNLNYVGHKRYIECMTDAQLAWLEKDLSYVPKGSLVFLNMHAAAWNKVENAGNLRNANALENVLKDYDVHVFCGHTHYFQNNEVSPHLYEHNIGAACGAWWDSWVNQCGAPNGYLLVDIKGNNLKWHYKGTRRSFSYQFQTYNKGEFKSQSSFIVANIWDWDKSCKVVWYQDGRLMGDMEQFVDVDENFAASKKGSNKELPKTGHLFRAMPSDGAKEIKIVFTNHFGEVFSQKLKM